MKHRRLPGTTVARDHLRGATFVTNPRWTEEQLRAAAEGNIAVVCHDQTPCMDFECACGVMNHLHLSQIEEAPEDFEVAARCSGCRQTAVVFRAGLVKRLLRESHGLVA